LDSYIFDIQVFFTGTPTGTFHLEASNDPAAQAVSRGMQYNLPTNWTTIANSTFTVSAAGNCQWDYSWPGFNFVRVVFTDASGGTSTGTITSCTFNAKG